MLIGTSADTNIISTHPKAEKNKKKFALPCRNADMHRVYAYLMFQRGIDRDVINAFVKKHLLYEEAVFHNCVFVGYDEYGKARHAHKRGTSSNTSFKCNAIGSDPQYSFHWNGSSDKMFLYEAPIDMLSYITMHKENWQQHNYVALCSVASPAAMKMLELDPNIKKVVLCLDNDNAGNTACERICELLRRVHPDIAVYRQAPIHKDFNEDLTKSPKNESEVNECQTLAY